MSCIYIIRVVLIGKTGSGKSQFLSQYINSSFNDRHNATTKAEVRQKIIEESARTIKLQIWDTPGVKPFDQSTILVIRGSALCLLLFDLADRKSFESLESFYNEVKSISNLPIFVIGNKAELTEIREVSSEEVQEFCMKLGVIYCECSARDYFSVDQVFRLVVHSIVDMVQSGGEAEFDGIKIVNRINKQQ